MNHTRSVVVFICVVTLIGAFLQPAVPVLAQGTGSTVTFEEAIPQPDSVVSQYCNNLESNKGVEFLQAARIIESPVATSSPTHALTNQFFGEEFAEFKTMEVRFTAPQPEVSVKAGLDRSHLFAVTAYLRAYRTSTPSATDLIAQSSIVLGSGPTPITNLLSVQDGAGEIRSIVIEFAGPQPGNAVVEVIDDLSYPVVGGTCLGDGSPPEVQITLPVAGEPVYAKNASRGSTLLSFVASDVGTGVAAVEVSFLDGTDSELESFDVCGSGGSPCDSPPSPVSRTFYTNFPFDTKTIRVSAWDYTNNLTIADRAITTVESALNVWAFGMEITQAVQPWVATNTDSLSGAPYQFTYPEEAVPLVADRTTVVRVFPGVEGTHNSQPLSGVRASLRCFTDAGFTIPCLGPSVIDPEHHPADSLYAELTVVPGDSLDTMRADIAKSWNFVLPSQWAGKGKVYLEAQVLAPDGVAECPACDDGANRLRVSHVAFQVVPHFGDDLVHFVSVQWQKSGTVDVPTPGTYVPSQADIAAVLDYGRKVFPVDETTIPTTAQATYVLQDDDNWNLDHRCDRVTGLLAQAFGNKGGKLAAFGLIHQLYPCSGRGGGGFSYANFNPANLSSFPHEVGHAVGLNHPGSPPGPPAGHAAECQNPGWCDTDWPYPHGGMGTFGFDVFEMEVIDPGSPPAAGHTHDLMSYGNPVWISPRNWIRMFNAFTDSTLPYPKSTSVTNNLQDAALETVDYLWVRGAFDDASGWTLLPAYEMAYARGPSGPGSGEYRIELRAEGGGLLGEHFFSVDDGHIDMIDLDPLVAPPSFSELVPLPEGVATISVHLGEEMLATETRSANAPEVALGSPTAEGFVRDTVGWIATDMDRGAVLYAMVQYSPSSSSEEWQTLATDITVENLAVDFALPGSPEGRVRVLVTDGVNTTAVVSPRFAVDNQRPDVQILTESTTIRQGDRVILRGSGYDAEDGSLPESALEWLSDDDGVLGTGSRLETTSLSLGEHEIVLTGTDSLGLADQDVILVVVEERMVFNHQPVAQAGPPELVVNGLNTPINGAASRDADGNALTYTWSVIAQPRGSAANLTASLEPQANLEVDTEGIYQVALIVNDGELDSTSDTVLIDFSMAPDRIVRDVALVDPASGQWHLRLSDGEVREFYFGTPGDLPMMGDWDCDGVDTPGLYRQSDGYVYLVNTNATGVASIRFHLGIPGDIPLAGDFDGDGCDTVSVYRSSEGRVYLSNLLGENESWFVAQAEYYFGIPGDKPHVGDFNGDGIDTVGLHRESSGFVYFLNRHATGFADSEFFYGIPHDRLVAGDWNGDGADSVAIYRPSDGRFYFRYTNTQGFADVTFDLGEGSWMPVAGTFE